MESCDLDERLVLQVWSIMPEKSQAWVDTQRRQLLRRTCRDHCQDTAPRIQ
jgi:hypothetical protein